AVDQLVDFSGIDAALTDAVDHALRQLMRRGQALRLHESLRRVVEADQIGERAADINRHKDHAGIPPLIAFLAVLTLMGFNRGGDKRRDHNHKAGAAQCRQVSARSSTLPSEKSASWWYPAPMTRCPRASSRSSASRPISSAVFPRSARAMACPTSG